MSRIRHVHYVQDGEPHGALDLFPGAPLEHVVQGQTYDPPQDEDRLLGALDRIRRALLTGRAFTLAELASIGQCSEAGASARVRQCRAPKEKGGCGLAVQSERVKGGLWHYRAIL